MFVSYTRGIGLMVGMLVGSGMFALPYAISKAGTFWGIATFAVAFFISVFMHLLYAEIAYYTKGKHRFVGYVGVYLGEKAKKLSFAMILLAFYCTILVYSLLSGSFLHDIFPSVSEKTFALAVFAAGGIISRFGFRKIGTLNFYLNFPIFGLVIYLFIKSLPFINLSNLANFSPINGFWFLPYGVWLFALDGTAIIPEVRDIFSDLPIKFLRRVVFWSILISAVLYFMFIISVLGMNGANTPEDAVSGLTNFFGYGGLVVGSLLGLLAVITSFLASAEDMKNVFHYDLGLGKWISWLFIVIPPVIMYMLGFHDFIKIISIIGVLVLGLICVFIILMSNSLRKKISQPGCEEILRDGSQNCMRPARLLKTIVLVGVFSSIIYELWHIFF